MHLGIKFSKLPETQETEALALTELQHNKFTIKTGACDIEPLRLLTDCNALDT